MNVNKNGFSGNSQRPNSIVRVIHNRENPFVQLSKEALWDSNLSLAAVGLWARCMSRPDNWVFSVAELVKKCKEGRCAIDSILHELMDHGYVARFEFKPKGEDGKFKTKIVEYVFFEFSATDEEINLQYQEFKKCYRDRGFRNLGDQDFGSSHLLIKKVKEKEDSSDNSLAKEKENTPPPPLAVCQNEPADAGGVCVENPQSPQAKIEKSYSAEVHQLAKKVVVAIQSVNPTYRPPSDLLKQIHYLVDTDKQNPDVVLQVLAWALKDDVIRGDFGGWSSIIAGKKGITNLRTNFSLLYGKMKAKTERKFAPDDGNWNQLAEKTAEWNKNAI